MRAKLFVGNLAYDTGIDKLEAVFRPFAGYLHTKICYDRHSGKALGYAVVHFDNPAAAQYAIDVLHNIEVDGRHIVVAPYRPRVGDPSAPKMPPKAPGAPSADEAVALVMDLHKTATWMDLKDILSQQSKVLFVDEPRMIRAAVVHFASAADRDQARAVFRNSHILGNAVDIVPVDKDSVVLDPGFACVGDQHFPMMQAQHVPAPMLPVPYMTPGMPPMPPYNRIDPGYALQRPAMWHNPGMPQYPQHIALGGANPATLHAAAAAAYQAMASAPPLQPGMPMPGSAPHADVPQLGQFSASMAAEYQPVKRQHAAQAPLPPNSPGQPQQHAAPAPPQQPQSFSSRSAAESSGDAHAAADASSTLSPELQQLVRQLALSRLGQPADNP